MARDHFDTLTRALTTSGPRRALLHLLATLPIVGTLLTLLGQESRGKDRRRRTKDRHHDHQQRRGKQKTRGRKHNETARQRKSKRKANAHQRQRTTPAPSPPPPCVPEPAAQTCAGTCATVSNTCGTPVDCGSCVCTPPCPLCQTCDDTTGACTNLTDGTACGEGLACVGGTCSCTTTSCATGCCQGDVCHVDEDGACGTGGGPCTPCTLPETCGGGITPGQCGCTPTTTCAAQHQTCGTLEDGCGTMLTCTGCTGCCAGNSCQGGQTERTACGSGGSSCQSCAGVCVGGSCTTCSVDQPCPSGLACFAGRCVNLQADIDAVPNGGTLTLGPGRWLLNRTIVISNDLTFRNNLTLVGAGAEQTILDGQDAVRVLRIFGVRVTVQDLTITRGRAGNSQGDNEGGGIRHEGSLTLRGVAVTANTATSGGGIAALGTSFSLDPTLTLEDGSTVSGNTANLRGGGIYAETKASVTLKAGSTVADNTATFDGGGILLNGFQDMLLTLQAGSRVTSNTANRDGGGIANGGGMVTLEDGSHVTGNTALNGGGISTELGGTVMLEAGSRVTGNTAISRGGIFNNRGTVTVEVGAIVCGNTARLDPDCGGDPVGGTCPQPSGVCPA